MMANQSQVSSSLEDYLEAIFNTVQSKGAARAKDIVQAMGVNNSSVTQALRSLSEKKLVNYAPYDLITLTDDGERIARDVLKRHVTLREFLSKVLGLKDDLADVEACRMEHATSPVILDRLVKFMEYFETCPQNEVNWNEELGFICADGADHANGKTCGRDSCGQTLHLPEAVAGDQANGEG